MPRKGRGGSRQGAPGQAYTNRSDLNQNRMPVQAAPGQTYGDRAGQERAQQAVPMGSPPSAVRASAAPPPPLNAPSSRPDEPLTAGMPFGEGPGPEAVARQPNPDLATLRRYLPALEIAASQDGATAGFKNLVRRLRGAMPTEG